MRELPIVDGASDQETSAGSAPAWWDDLQSIPDLRQAVIHDQTTAPTGAVLLTRALRSIKGQSTATLIHRLTTVEHPMTAWALHVELDARGVPPCLRPWMPERSRQVDYLATLADLLWLASRYPEHVTKYERLRGVFRYPARDDRWHRAAIWAYRQCRGHRHVLAARLGLTDAMRAHTLTMPTARQSNDRRLLRNDLSRITTAMIAHAVTRPDKSGRTTPEGVASRRIKMLTTFVMLDRNQTDTVKQIALMDGIAITRQTLARQLRAASTTGNCARIVFGLCGSPWGPIGPHLPNTPQTRARARFKGVRLQKSEGGA